MTDCWPMIEKVPNVATEYPFKQYGIEIQSDDLMDGQLASRISHAEDAMRYLMNVGLYGDWEPPRIKTGWERFSDRLGLYRSRIRDAWAVLTGKSEIGDGW